MTFSRKFIIVFALFAVNIALFQNCANTSPDFQESTDNSSSTYSGPVLKVTENFTTATEHKKIDMVWVIDNSGSMKNENEHVQNNFEAFVRSLKDRVDLKAVLVTKKRTGSEDGTGIDIPSVSGVDLTQIQHTVASTDPLLISALAMCPEAPKAGGFCSKFKSTKQAASEKFSDKKYDKIYSSLHRFFRTNSRKVFVYVTDDNSDHDNPFYIKREQFVNVFNERFPGERPVMFGFVGQNKTDCKVTNVGQLYIDMARTYSGRTFNICDTDWTPNFTAISQKVKEIALNEFSLNSGARIVRIHEVRLNGAPLRTGEFILRDNLLVVDKSLLGGYGTYQIEVTYDKEAG